MRYTLLPYQDAAVAEIMDNLDTARNSTTPAAFALSAPTGAGKTVIATAVFERLLFHSNTSTPDPKAVVLWLSDNPDLNTQSRFRIEQASDKLSSRTQEITSDFNEDIFTPGTIYFLNTQKIGKGTKLTTINDPAVSNTTRPDGQQITIWDTIRNTINSPDHTLYLVVDEAHRGAATQYKNKTTILRRMIEGHTPEGHATPVPPIPIVMGISATPGAFKQMLNTMNATMLTIPDVTVDVDAVQESGLIKDTVYIYTPDSTASRIVLAREGARACKRASTLWANYHQRQHSDGDPVAPLMVVQMRDKTTTADLDDIVRAIREGWPELADNAFANVYGEHTDLHAGGVDIPYIQPQYVQESTHIRVLFAKTAISTGWDCPRAEVLVSYRTAKDAAHIAQIIGRMVRSPLARRIDGDDELNTVICMLPMFDVAGVNAIVDAINDEHPGGGSGEGNTQPFAVTERENLSRHSDSDADANIDSADTDADATAPDDADVGDDVDDAPDAAATLMPSEAPTPINTASDIDTDSTDDTASADAATTTPAESTPTPSPDPAPAPATEEQHLVRHDVIDEVFTSLPRMVKPNAKADPVSMCLNLGAALQEDGFRAQGGNEARTELHNIINGKLAQYSTQVAQHRDAILTVNSALQEYNVHTGALTDTDGTTFAANVSDTYVIKEAFADAVRVFTQDVATSWVKDTAEHTATSNTDNDKVIALQDAQLQLAALARVDGIADAIDRDANALATGLLDTHAADISGVSDERAEVYNRIRGMAAAPTVDTLRMPTTITAIPRKRHADGTTEEYPRYAKHILTGDDGCAPMKLNGWERKVIETELARPTTRAWYRNPHRAGATALSIVYRDSITGTWNSMQPDFIVFRDGADGEITASILDPHGAHLSDALDKLRALADYAERYGKHFAQILSLSAVDVTSTKHTDTLVSLDLTHQDIRDAVRAATTAREVYTQHGSRYA